jgi:hypothetical protein
MSEVMGDDALLADALRHLLESWAMTSEAWRDQARRDFQDQHLLGIEDRTRMAAKAVKLMETLISDVRRQCR